MMSITALSQVKPFDGAEGGGRYAYGLLPGADSYVVTNNSNDPATPGSAIYGLENAPSAGRVIVANKGIGIDMQEGLYYVTANRIYFMGNSTPEDSGGFGIYNGTWEIRSDNSTFQFMTFQLGDYGYKDANGDVLDASECCVSPPDGLGIYLADNVMIRNVDEAFGLDEGLSVSTSGNVTVQDSFVMHSLHASVHQDGAHSMSALVNLNDTTKVISYIRVGMFNSMDRHIRSARSTYEMINCYIYGYYGESVVGSGQRWAAIGNVWEPRPGFPTYNTLVINETNDSWRGLDDGTVYYADNIRDGVPGTVDATLSTELVATAADAVYTEYVLLPSSQVKDSVLANSGNWWPQRSALNQKVINDALNGTGEIIDTQEQVGGFSTFSPGTTWTDSDGDNMDDALEVAFFGDLSQSDMGDLDGNGRVNIVDLYNSRTDNYVAPTVGYTVSSISGTVSESGTSATFTIVLDHAPSSNVVFTITSQDTGEVTAAPSSATFTTGNWSTPQTITVTGVPDGINDGNQTTDITVSVDDASSDDQYDPLPDQSVQVSTIDVDSPGGENPGSGLGLKSKLIKIMN